MMKKQLKVSMGQSSQQGRKTINQDAYGVCIPENALLATKGVAIALADGISSSQVSQVASEAAVKGFLEDYFCTSESWSVKTSAQRVIQAINSWLYAQTRRSEYRYNKDKGYVCTFSALVFKASTAYLFHVGDTRIYRQSDEILEQLTEDHRTWESSEKSYLARALGVNENIEVDYQKLSIMEGDVFMLATDGIYEFMDEKRIIQILKELNHSLQQAAEKIVHEAYENGSDDNLTVQVVKIERLPDQDQVFSALSDLPFPPKLQPRDEFDGYEILREISITHRSYIYLARDIETNKQLVLKLPSTEFQNDKAYLERFLMEEWIARRIDSVHVLKPSDLSRQKHYLYSTYEYIEGQTLHQWMLDHPTPNLETVRTIIEQIAKGLFAFHRQEMIHQDLRPNNILVDHTGTVKIIDFGATRVAGVAEMATLFQPELLGTAAYTAPEYFLGEAGSASSDQFSLGVIAYQMLSGRLPYGTSVAKARTKSAQRNLRYQSVLDDDLEIPAWVDQALRKALHPDPFKRYGEISEFVYDLRHPNPAFLAYRPIMERNPLLFWKMTSLVLFAVILFLLWKDLPK